uniref:Peptidase S1 domain-containing protein n=1 Tax=Globodera pallida TaxID=36090 RepID=A0A183CRL9_GLOPA
MLCNIQASRQTQPGDSGGPLMREARGKWFLLGVTKGHSCDTRSCFTRITPHCNWISDKTNGDVKCYGNIA